MLLKRSVLLASIICLTLFSCVKTFSQTPQHAPLTKAIKDSLKKEIEAMLAADQKYRWMIMFGEMDEQKLAELRAKDDKEQWKRMRDAQDNKVGISQQQRDSLWVFQSTIDSTNFIKISAIILKYGFPKKYVAAYNVTTILQHNSDLIDDAFLKVLRQEVDNGNMPATEYATVYDDVQAARKLPRLYNDAERYDEATNSYRQVTPKDKEATNKAREEIGLKKLK